MEGRDPQNTLSVPCSSPLTRLYISFRDSDLRKIKFESEWAERQVREHWTRENIKVIRRYLTYAYHDINRRQYRDHFFKISNIPKDVLSQGARSCVTCEVMNLPCFPGLRHDCISRRQIKEWHERAITKTEQLIQQGAKRVTCVSQSDSSDSDSLGTRYSSDSDSPNAE